MLDEFKEKQPLFYEEITKSIENKKISHAYLIETNNYLESNNLILSFVKTLFYSFEKENDDFSNTSTLIDNNIFSDFIIVEPDGAWIKKEQILDIKEKFKTSSTEDRPRIYLIKEADKLNKYAANSLLKFLEEPEGNVIAILTTDNRYKILETVRSRCQIYTLINNDRVNEFSNFDLLKNIIEVFENKGQASIAYLPTILENDYKNKDFWIEIFNCMIDVYENAIRKINNISYHEYDDVISLIIEYNTVEKIINKIDILFKTIKNLEFNLNINMMLDKFIIDFTGGECSEKNSWC